MSQAVTEKEIYDSIQYLEAICDQYRIVLEKIMFLLQNRTSANVYDAVKMYTDLTTIRESYRLTENQEHILSTLKLDVPFTGVPFSIETMSSDESIINALIDLNSEVIRLKTCLTFLSRISSPPARHIVSSGEIKVNLCFRGGKKITDFKSLTMAVDKWNEVFSSLYSIAEKDFISPRIFSFRNNCPVLGVIVDSPVAEIFLRILSAAADRYALKLNVMKARSEIMALDLESRDMITELEKQEAEKEERLVNIVIEKIVASCVAQRRNENKEAIRCAIETLYEFYTEGGEIELEPVDGHDKLMHAINETSSKIDSLKNNAKISEKLKSKESRS